jgi:hypothetical protein
MTFAAPAARAAFLMAKHTLQQRAAQQLAGDRQGVHLLLARPKNAASFHRKQ